MKNLNDLVQEIEIDLVANLAFLTRKNKLSLKEAREIAKDFTDNYPFKNYEDLFKKLYVLSQKYKILRKIYVRYSPKYFHAKRIFILKKMREAIDNNETEKAIKIAKIFNYG